MDSNFSRTPDYCPDLVKALEEERTKKENKQAYHPILTRGVIFDRSAPSVEQTQPAQDEGVIIPPFCVVDENLSPTTAQLPESTTSIPVSNSTTMDALGTIGGTNLPVIPPATSILQPSPSNPIESPVAAPSPKATITAYMVKEALHETLELRLVGNALYAFDGFAYTFVSREQMNRLIMENCRQYVEIVGNAFIIRQVYELIQAEPLITQNKQRIPSNLVALNNGLLDIESGQLYPHSPIPFVTVRVKGSFLPEQVGNCPCFVQFLTDISGDDPLLIQRIWEMIGYCLVPDTDGKCFFVLQGVPDSGKSLLGKLIAECFDEDAVTSLDIKALGLQFGTAELVGKQLCLSLDLAATSWDSNAVGVLKSLTGNDLVSADVKYQPRIKFRNSATFIFATNHAVTTTMRDDAFFRRLIAVPFRYSIPRERQNQKLLNHFQREKDAIITTAIMAYQRLRQNAYRFSGNYRINEVISDSRKTDVYTIEQAVADFFYLDCVLDPEALAFTDDLHQRFMLRYPEFTDIIAFSSAFAQFFNTSFSGRVNKTRKRKAGVKNPTSAFEGVRLKREETLL